MLTHCFYYNKVWVFYSTKLSVILQLVDVLLYTTRWRVLLKIKQKYTD